jgi:hypothetical protein
VSSAVGTTILALALTVGGAAGDKPAVPRPVLETGLKTAKCTLPPNQAKIVGTELLSSHLRLVEVACWETATNAGSILFAVPLEQPRNAQLVSIDRWQNGEVKHGYSVPSPGFDAKTRTLSSTRMARDAGDCGTIQEMKWTGWHFRLLRAWSKDRCDGEPFEWDSREGWQVFPRRGVERNNPDSVSRHERPPGVELGLR